MRIIKKSKLKIFNFSGVQWIPMNEYEGPFATNVHAIPMNEYEGPYQNDEIGKYE